MIKNVNESWFKRNMKKIKLVAITTVTVVGLGLGGLHWYNENSYKFSDYYKEHHVEQTYDYTTDITVEPPKDTESSEESISQVIIDNTTEAEEVITQITEEEVTYKPVDINFEDKDVSFNGIDTSSLINQINGYKVNYQGSQYFNTKASLDKYYSMKEYESNNSLKYISNNKVNETALRNNILSNNKQFLDNQSVNKYQDYSSTYFELAFKALVATINKQLAECPDIDVAQLDENLGDLKILNCNLQGNGYVTDDTIILSVNQKAVVYFGGDNLFYYVACHETNHLIQTASKTEKANEGYAKNTGLYYEWSDLNVNALAYQWFVEGSAEKLVLAENDVPSNLVAYQENIKSIDSLTLAAIIRDDVDELTVPRLSLQPNLDKLFAIYNCDTDAEKEEFINMMYSFEIIYNKSDAFYNASGITDKFHYEYSLSSSIAQTLTKKFYENLTIKLSNGNEKMSNIFSLIALFESDMNRITKYYDSSKAEYNKDFVSMYTQIQYGFFSKVAESTGLSVDEVYSMYAEYYNNANQINNSSNLDRDEMNYFDDMFDSRENIKPNGNLSTFKAK